MAIFGSLGTVRDQVQHDVRFAAALIYAADILQKGSIAQQRILAMAAGSNATRIELARGAFALEAAYMTKARSEGFFESHRKYIDVQIVVAGEELIEVQDLSRLIVSEDYHAERDFVKHADSATASILKMQAGDIAIFFPEDGHMPSLRWRTDGLVCKTVVKVPVTRE